MSYPVIVLIHLLAAMAFIGIVFFEVIFLGDIRSHVPKESMSLVEKEIGTRARKLVPWILLTLFSAGFILAWYHRATLINPFATSFGILFSLKILLALSVFGHFATVMTLRKKGKFTSAISKRIHISVFCHVISIVILAKLMFHIRW